MTDDDKKYCYRYPHPAVTADCVIFGFDGERIKILLIERGLEPYKGMWALPGGFMHIDETIEQTARRELCEETGLREIYLEQFKVFSGVDRDPRERVITVAFIALVRPDDYRLTAGDDAANAMWFDDRYLPPMAFDHAAIIKSAREHLSEALRVRPLAFKLLDKYFSMSELQRVYEAITGANYDRRNFQRKAMQSGLLVEDNADESSCAELSVPMIAPCCAETDTKYMKQPGPRARKKLFTYNKKRKRDGDDEDEASIRDIFNF